MSFRFMLISAQKKKKVVPPSLQCHQVFLSNTVTLLLLQSVLQLTLDLGSSEIDIA